MSLREFFALHRQELLLACNSESNAETEIAQRARELCELLDEPPDTDRRSSRHSDGTALAGHDPGIKRVRASIERLVRRSRTPVLFLGEVGTGKRRAARLLHASTYPDGELFELINDQQLPLLERRLAVLRVPSSALAIGGLSVYVHELGDTSRAVQAALAKLLREHGINCRLMASSQEPLAHACREGFLRSDLAIAFSATVELPSLRERLAALPELIQELSSPARPPLIFSEAALHVLKDHAWPGNLIELSRLVERLQWLDRVGSIEPEHLTELGHRRSGAVLKLTPRGIDLADLERQLLLQALQLTDNNRTRAARLLGLTRDQIRYRLTKFGLELGPEEDRAAE